MREEGGPKKRRYRMPLPVVIIWRTCDRPEVHWPTIEGGKSYNGPAGLVSPPEWLRVSHLMLVKTNCSVRKESVAYE